VVQPNSQFIEFTGVGTVDTDFDLIQAGFKQSLGSRPIQECSVGKDFDPLYTHFFGKRDSLWQLFVQKRFAKVVQVDHGAAVRSALSNDLFIEMVIHEGFFTADRLAGAKCAAGITMVRGLDADGGGKLSAKDFHNLRHDTTEKFQFFHFWCQSEIL